MGQHSFSWQDYTVFVTVLVISVAIGIYQACTGGRQRTNMEYFLGDRKLNFLPVGLSILVTFQSCLTFMGVPAETYTKGISYLLAYIGLFIAAVILYFIIIPLFYPLKLISTYEYLERRFQSKLARIIGSVLSMLNMLLFGGVNIYAPAIAIAAVSEIPSWLAIIVIGVLATVYTSLGGLRAVVWTDVFQCLIMVIGLLALLIQGSVIQGGISRVWQQSVEGGRTNFGSWSADPRERHTIWSLLIGGTLLWVINLGVTQASVQRISSVSSMKDARLAIIISLPGFIIFGISAALVGLITYSYFLDKACDPLAAGIISNPNQLIIIFLNEVLQFMPGFTGLFVATLCCAALSSVSSCINGLSAMAWEDIFKDRCTEMSPRSTNILVKIFGMFYRLVLVAVAFLAMSTPGSIIQIGISFIGASGGPLLGMFCLGAFFSRSNWIGVSSGAVVSVILCMWLALGSNSITPSPSLSPAPVTNCSTWTNISLISVQNASSLDSSYELVDITTDPPARFTESSVLEPFYRISYLWYSSLGVITVVLVGLVVSYLTGPMDAIEIERDLYFSPMEQLAAIFPESITRRCCVDYTGTEKDSNTKFQSDHLFSDNKNGHDKISEKDALYPGLLDSKV